MIVVTNNPLLMEKYPDLAFEVTGNPLDVMEEVMDKVQNGYNLVGMPISGNLRLARSPYRSVVIKESDKEPNIREYLLVSDACNRLKEADIQGIPSRTHDDYKYMDVMFVEDVFVELGSKLAKN